MDSPIAELARVGCNVVDIESKQGQTLQSSSEVDLLNHANAFFHSFLGLVRHASLPPLPPLPKQSMSGLLRQLGCQSNKQKTWLCLRQKKNSLLIKSLEYPASTSNWNAVTYYLEMGARKDMTSRMLLNLAKVYRRKF